MKVKLNLKERIQFLNLLPRENNFATLRIIRKVEKEVGITDEDFKEFGIKQIPATAENPSGQFRWDQKKGEIEKEFEVGEIAHQLIKTVLEKLDTDKKLTQDQFSLYEKFVDKKEDSS